MPSSVRSSAAPGCVGPRPGVRHPDARDDHRGRATALEERLRDLSRRELVELETDPVSPERGQYRFVRHSSGKWRTHARTAGSPRASPGHRPPLRGARRRGTRRRSGQPLPGGLRVVVGGSRGRCGGGSGAHRLRAAVDRAVALGAHEQALAHIGARCASRPTIVSGLRSWSEPPSPRCAAKPAMPSGTDRGTASIRNGRRRRGRVSIDRVARPRQDRRR